MKNKIILGIILIGLLFCLSGCSYSRMNKHNLEYESDTFITVVEEGYVDNEFVRTTIIIDKRTGIQYLNGKVVLLNQDGTPLLYGGE